MRKIMENREKLNTLIFSNILTMHETYLFIIVYKIYKYYKYIINSNLYVLSYAWLSLLRHFASCSGMA